MATSVVNQGGRSIKAEESHPVTPLLYDPATGLQYTPESVLGKLTITNYIWDSNTLAWIKQTAASSGGGGPVTIADGDDTAEGTTTDLAYVSGAGTVISILKGIFANTSGGGSAVSIADGANVVEGALADAAIVTDTTGTINGKLRGLVKWAFERMPAALGQGSMAQSLSVVIASNQSALPVASHAVTNAGTFATQDDARATGGADSYSIISTATVLAAQIKGAAGTIYSIQCFNIDAAPIYVRLYNQTGAPASTDGANIIWRGLIPGNTTGAGFGVTFPKGRICSAGIGIRATTGIADNNTGALTADKCLFNVGYK